MAKISMKLFRDKLSRGISESELKSIQHNMIAPGWKVGDLIEASLDFEEMEWKIINGKKTLIQKRNND
jgi:hypothetical protein